ncbi:asparaginase [Cohnella kolymensis]|uniref:Asparaginase n=1 Tax=Cohnella kolymensis TaxID=1590652 RepID=A0ABR5A9F8_9BACL|nr:asparaginase [Cohnella kolymensis]KIL37680.1 asparaginase [Cohnella kolymensis]
MIETLVEEYRGNVLENTHSGRICGVNERGEVVYSIGDVEQLTYLRSSAKPLQALPSIQRGVQEKYNLTDIELALLGASHRGEPFHIEALESLSRKVGLNEDNLICLPTYPLNPDARDRLFKSDHPKRKIYHNCSGKHFGIMSLCKLLAVEIDNYWEREHAAQQEILKTVSIMSGYPADHISLGVDGCGVPVFALPLRNIAQAYMTLACPDLIENVALGKAVQTLTRIMNEQSRMIGGTDQICSTLLQDPNIVAKGGAKGIYCFGLKNERLGFALKVSDGSEEEWPLIVAGILQQIDYSNQSTINNMLRLSSQKVINDNNRIVGENKISFHLSAYRRD